SQQFLQQCFSFDERQCSQVFAVEIQQVKGDEDALATAEQQIAEHRPTSFIHAGNLAVEHGTFNVKVFSDPCRKIRKAAEGVSISGDEFTSACRDMRERPKAIDLQFEDELIGIERFNAAGKPDRS